MEIWVQNKLITHILAPFGKISAHFSEKTRDRFFVACGFMIFLMTMIYGSQYHPFRFLYAFAFNCLMLGIMILCSLRQDLVPVVFDKKLLVLGLVFGSSALISGLLLDTDYLSWAILCLVVYPVIYIVWNNIDVAHVFGLLLKTNKFSFLFYFLVHFLFYPIERRKYQGISGNQNSNAFFLALFACCFFLELLIGKEKKRDYIFPLICYGLNGALLYCTNSRTGLLAVLLSHVFSIVLLLLIFKSSFLKLYGKRIVALVLSVFLFIPVIVFLFQIPKLCLGMVQESLSATIALAFEDIQGTWLAKIATEGKDVETISSGRIDIWKGYLSHLRLTGHAKSDTFTIVIEGREYTNGIAHMMILDYAYQFGILAGLSFFGINLIAGIKSILYALKRGEREIITLFPFMISIAYGVISLLSHISSFAVPLGLYYFLAQAPLVKRGLEEKNNA